MNLATKVKSWLGLGAEGSWRGPFFGTGELGGRYGIEALGDGWQRNLSIGGRNASVAALQAAIGAHVSAFTLMPVAHKRKISGGGFEVVESSAITRWLRHPNAFQTLGEFMSVMIRQLLETGNAVAVLARNNRYEIVTSVPVNSYTLHTDPESGEIFYWASLADGRNQAQMMVPARDILHLKINAPIHDLMRGRSPIQFCASSLAANVQLMGFLNSYMANRASPSYALSTDLPLTGVQMKQLRDAWNEQSQALASGGTPIMGNGLKPVQLGVAPGDDLLVSTFNMTVEDVARAFNMPRALLGITETAANAEQLMRSWVSLGLGSMVELVEQAIEKSFDMAADEHVEFDHTAMLRLDSEAQMRVISEAVVKGIFSADEGRALLGLAPIPGGYGKVPAAQQQQVPLDLLHQLHMADLSARLRPEPEPAPEPAKDEKPAEPEKVEDKSADPVVARALTADLLQRVKKVQA